MSFTNAYQATNFLEGHLDAVRSQVTERLDQRDRDDRIGVAAEALEGLLGNNQSIEDGVVEEFWESVDWRLLAEMFFDVDEEQSI
jgi:hypothetical protein